MRTKYFIPVLLLLPSCVKRSWVVPGFRHQFLDRARNDPLAPNLFLDST
jgi:hypothetical protein